MAKNKKVEQMSAPMATLEREGALALIEWPIFLALRLKTLEPHLELTETGQELLQAARTVQTPDTLNTSQPRESEPPVEGLSPARDRGSLLSGLSTDLRARIEGETVVTSAPISKPADAVAATAAPEKRFGDASVSSNEPQMIPLARINWKGGTQARIKGVEETTVQEYAAAIKSGAKFPPIVVFWDGKTLWPADGFHRGAAHIRLGSTEIATIVRRGTRRDAILFGLSANGSHGLRYSTEDKRNAIRMVLSDPESVGLSDRQIALLCGVDHKTVGAARRAMTQAGETERAGTVDPGLSNVISRSPMDSQNTTSAAGKVRSSSLRPTSRKQ